MDRRRDSNTAEKIDMALLTKAAFDLRTALTYAALAGLKQSFILAVFARGPQHVRQYQSAFLRTTDRRTTTRPQFATA
jgi:hypothetical protein